MITLSKRKARRIEDWLKVMESVHENDVVTGYVTRKIKGGLLVDISGVNVFLPASQVDIRRPADIGDLLWPARSSASCSRSTKPRRNIVVSRRALIEQERAERKKQLMETLDVGQIRRGIVKNIADFGAFRGSGRHRRPASHHRHVVGPHRASQRDGGHRPGDRGAGAAHRPRAAKRSPWA